MKWFTSFIIILICRCQMASTFAQSEVYQLDAPFYLTTNNSDCKLYLYDNNLFTMTGITAPSETYPISIGGTWEQHLDTLTLTFNYSSLQWYMDIPTEYQIVFKVGYSFQNMNDFGKSLTWIHFLKNQTVDLNPFFPIGNFRFTNFDDNLFDIQPIKSFQTK